MLSDDLSSELVQYMPGVQALARRGTSFSNYIVSDSLCCPSRSSIFTGEFPHNTGVYANQGPGGGFDAFIRRHDERHTFATALQRAGYRTAFLGKYLNGYSPGTPQGPRGSASSTYEPPGWNEWDGVGSAGYRGFGYTINENRHLVAYPADDRYYLTSVLQQRATAFMRAAAAQRSPYFLEVATFTPHLPYVPAPQDRHSFAALRFSRGPAFNRLPRNAPTWLAGHRAIPRHGQQLIDHIERLRVQAVQSIDRLLTGLERTAAAVGQTNDTIFVFSSDNGLHLGQYRLRAGKMTAFDTDIRVPLVVAGPGIQRAQVVDDITQNVDLAPTFEQLAGAPIRADVDGVSLEPLLAGRHPAWRTAALVEHKPVQIGPGDPDQQSLDAGQPPTYTALRTARFAYVVYRDGEREYYDLRHDPNELDNLARSLPRSRRQHLDAWLSALAVCRGTGCRTAGRISGS